MTKRVDEQLNFFFVWLSSNEGWWLWKLFFQNQYKYKIVWSFFLIIEHGASIVVKGVQE
jgi:hypothetical protein